MATTGYGNVAFTLANNAIANCEFTGGGEVACRSCIIKAIERALADESDACAFIAERRLFGREPGWHTRNPHGGDTVTEINEITRLIRSRRLVAMKQVGA